ncbi:hypothetical protein [Mesobacterium pallidum]|uniref:hypothetical protein n=1 Tax=Mesobacterium pallidum TaxID=2872037 RepID=UPI001EE3880D|nr:hypothetical protein [Mesobacterium pallidum]
MSDIDPNTHRHIQTRDGVASIPRSQQGVMLKDYFRNTELPQDLDRAMVYVTEKGPVIATPDPESWSEKHDQMARDYADKLKLQIDDKGYYSKTLNLFAERLSEATGHSRDEMKAVIAKSFETRHSTDPYTYLSEQRLAQGKPVRGQDQEIAHERQ